MKTPEARQFYVRVNKVQPCNPIAAFTTKGGRIYTTEKSIEDIHVVEISALQELSAQVVELRNALEDARDVIFRQANYFAIEKLPAIAMLLHDKSNQITRILAKYPVGGTDE